MGSERPRNPPMHGTARRVRENGQLPIRRKPWKREGEVPSSLFFFISIMFPTIFAMGTKNLGTRKKLGGSYMIMAIVGGAIMPYFMGLIADYTHTAAAFLLPLCCFVCVVLYGAAYGRLVKE